MSNYTVVELRNMYVARGLGSAAQARKMKKAELVAALGLSMSQAKRRSTKGRKRGPRKAKSPSKKSPSKKSPSKKSPSKKSPSRPKTPSPARSRGSSPSKSPRTSPSAMKVDDLKAWLKRNNLPVSGKKEVLVQRVRDHKAGVVHPRKLTPQGKRKALGCSPNADKPCKTKKARAAKASLPTNPTVEQLDKALDKAGMKKTGNKAAKKNRLANPTGNSYTDAEVAKAVKKRVSGKRKSPGSKSPAKKPRGRPRKM